MNKVVDTKDSVFAGALETLAVNVKTCTHIPKKIVEEYLDPDRATVTVFECKKCHEHYAVITELAADKDKKIEK